MSLEKPPSKISYYQFYSNILYNCYQSDNKISAKNNTHMSATMDHFATKLMQQIWVQKFSTNVLLTENRLSDPKA